MSGPEQRALSDPDEVRTFDKGKNEVVKIGGGEVGRSTLEPGWRWSICVKPIAGTDLCEMAHAGYVVSGRLHIQMADGTECDLTAGEVCAIPPGHDAWVVGDEPTVMIDWAGAGTYGK